MSGPLVTGRDADLIGGKDGKSVPGLSDRRAGQSFSSSTREYEVPNLGASGKRDLFHSHRP
jgi:hypothetical protein